MNGQTYGMYRGNTIERHDEMTLEDCKYMCNKIEGCNSIRFCQHNKKCFLKGIKLTGSEPTGGNAEGCFYSARIFGAGIGIRYNQRKNKDIMGKI